MTHTDTRHVTEVEDVLLSIEDAENRARGGIDELDRAGAPSELVEALDLTAQRLDAERRRLLGSIGYSFPYQEQLAVPRQERLAV